ncbi:MAG TPA: thiamine biosynthesis protein ThiS [Lachnospiraceae bacterium]|nr:sulfur carrier protein ThiS [uncultured Lachnoclostridium sp.]HAU88281.1 thiamine biosynthesis protein ThiS [Lachnospiraceae bacterium]
MIQLNGELIANYEQKTLQNLLTTLNYDLTKIAVEKNGEIIPKSQYDTTILNENDVLEIVTFVGGG